MSTLQPPDLLRTIYLGDRACKAVQIESWKGQVALQVNLLSRIRSSSGNWEFYSAEDIADGRLVFTGVDTLEFSPPGPLPNDLINEVSVELADSSSNGKRWRFEISIDSVAADGSRTEIVVRLTATGLHIEDPARPGAEIID